MVNTPFFTFFRKPFVITYPFPKLCWVHHLCIPIMLCTSISAHLPHHFIVSDWFLGLPNSNFINCSLKAGMFTNFLVLFYFFNPGQNDEFIWTKFLEMYVYLHNKQLAVYTFSHFLVSSAQQRARHIKSLGSLLNKTSQR